LGIYVKNYDLITNGQLRVYNHLKYYEKIYSSTRLLADGTPKSVGAVNNMWFMVHKCWLING